MKVPNLGSDVAGKNISLSRLQNEGSQRPPFRLSRVSKSIKATE